MSSLPFTVLVLLEPLGLLYGSSGRVLSPGSLTGRAAEHFPPDAPAVSGLLASHLPREELRHLFTAGPFWLHRDGELMLPAPLLLVQEPIVQEPIADPGGSVATSLDTPSRRSRRLLHWQDATDTTPSGWVDTAAEDHVHKSPSGGWIRLSDWPYPHRALPDQGIPIHDSPWQAVPHLHPKLSDHERVSAKEDALFLEYGIALSPGVRLAYLSSHAMAEGLVRFGGEGHLVQLRCQPLPPLLLDLLRRPLSPDPFALITPGVWGGPKLSIREPIDTTVPGGRFPWRRNGHPPGLLTDRPRPWRYRLGAGADGQRRLSRGRWALPAGTCYRVGGEPLPPWSDWEERWFPKEGLSLRHFGTALSLP
ncbi:MAG: type III-B CRISPR module-associated Cmr3 family protein, partial [Cyanobacteriota bacterium]